MITSDSVIVESGHGKVSCGLTSVMKIRMGILGNRYVVGVTGKFSYSV